MLWYSIFVSLPNATTDNNTNVTRYNTKANIFIRCSLFNIKIKKYTASFLHLWRGLVSFYIRAKQFFPKGVYVESVESEVWQSHRERLHESDLSNTISFHASLFYLKCIAIITSIKAFSLVSVYFPKWWLNKRVPCKIGKHITQ